MTDTRSQDISDSKKLTDEQKAAAFLDNLFKENGLTLKSTIQKGQIFSLFNFKEQSNNIFSELKKLNIYCLIQIKDSRSYGKLDIKGAALKTLAAQYDHKISAASTETPKPAASSGQLHGKIFSPAQKNLTHEQKAAAFLDSLFKENGHSLNSIAQPGSVISWFHLNEKSNIVISELEKLGIHCDVEIKAKYSYGKLKIEGDILKKLADQYDNKIAAILAETPKPAAYSEPEHKKVVSTPPSGGTTVRDENIKARKMEIERAIKTIKGSSQLYRKAAKQQKVKVLEAAIKYLNGDINKRDFDQIIKDNPKYSDAIGKGKTQTLVESVEKLMDPTNKIASTSSSTSRSYRTVAPSNAKYDAFSSSVTTANSSNTSQSTPESKPEPSHTQSPKRR